MTDTDPGDTNVGQPVVNTPRESLVCFIILKNSPSTDLMKLIISDKHSCTISTKQQCTAQSPQSKAKVFTK